MAVVGRDQCARPATRRVAPFDRVQGSGQCTQVGGGLCLMVSDRRRSDIQDRHAEQDTGQPYSEQHDRGRSAIASWPPYRRPVSTPQAHGAAPGSGSATAVPLTDRPGTRPPSGGTAA